MKRFGMAGLLVLLSLTGHGADLPPADYEVLHSFGGTKTDGTSPFAEPTVINNWLFGTTWKGGENNLGVVYAMQIKSGTYRTLHDFSGKGDGAQPQGGLCYYNLDFYGATGQGGAYGAGTLFSIDRKTGGYAKLYDFGGISGDGKNPIGTLIASDDLLYGVTASGGNNNKGTIFAIDPDGAGCKALHHFTGAPGGGDYPLQGLTRYKDTLYGATMRGGKSNMGILFAIDTDGTDFKVLHHFAGTATDGSEPWCRLLPLRKKLYGTTMRGGQYGNGVLFSINLDGTGYANLHHFCKTIEQGAAASGCLETDGRFLYGTTQLGGVVPSGGILYSFDLFDSTFSILHSFGATGGDAGSPYGGPVLALDTLYGASFKGGSGGDGAIYAYEVPYLDTAPAAIPEAKENDFDGDRVSDAVVYHPQTGNWYIRESGSEDFVVRQFGWSAAIPVPADYDGDGTIDLCVYWPEESLWYMQNSRTGLTVIERWEHPHTPDALPLPGDYDGDGRADLTLYEPASGLWHIRRSSSRLPYTVQLGAPGAQPAPGDYNGDGITDPAVYDAARDTWHMETGTLIPMQVTLPADRDARPAHADYDGDGKTDCAVYVPRTGMWTIRSSANGMVYTRNWGFQGAQPAPADYDGDGRDDIGVYHQANGNWYLFKSGTQQGETFNWGWSAAVLP